MVRFDAAAQSNRRIYRAPEIIRRGFQNQIAGVDVEKVVDNFETADVEVNYGVGDVGIGVHELGGFFVESFAAQETRERINFDVVLHFVDEFVLDGFFDAVAAVFVAGKDVVDAVPDDGSSQRRRHKFHCARI